MGVVTALLCRNHLVYQLKKKSIVPLGFLPGEIRVVSFTWESHLRQGRAIQPREHAKVVSVSTNRNPSNSLLVFPLTVIY